MQFKLSVYFQESFLSYLITSEDEITFHFKLKSAPAEMAPLPDEFNVHHPAPEQWVFDRELDEEFRQGIIATMTKTRL